MDNEHLKITLEFGGVSVSKTLRADLQPLMKTI